MGIFFFVIVFLVSILTGVFILLHIYCVGVINKFGHYIVMLLPSALVFRSWHSIETSRYKLPLLVMIKHTYLSITGTKLL